MKIKTQIININGLVVGALWLLMPVGAYAMDPSDKEIAAMEEHWAKVTNETDAEKRRKLIDEHRKMMSSYSSIEIPGHDGPMGDMHSHDREMHIKNTVDMHANMMDMMH